MARDSTSDSARCPPGVSGELIRATRMDAMDPSEEEDPVALDHRARDLLARRESGAGDQVSGHEAAAVERQAISKDLCSPISCLHEVAHGPGQGEPLEGRW